MKRNTQRGFSLIELLICVAILVMLISAIAGVLVALERSSAQVRNEQAVESAAETSLDRMIREARNAYTINISQSTFNANPGQLTLDTTEGGASTTIEFFVSGGAVHVKEGGVDAGALSTTASDVTYLEFQDITTPVSEAVKIEMTIAAGTSTSAVSRSFYATAVLRGSY